MKDKWHFVSLVWEAWSCKRYCYPTLDGLFTAGYNLVPRVPHESAVGKRATLNISDWKSEKIELAVECTWLKRDAGVLLPLISIVYKTNQNQACNGRLESHSFGQVCAVRTSKMMKAATDNTQNKNKFYFQGTIYALATRLIQELTNKLKITKKKNPTYNWLSRR